MTDTRYPNIEIKSLNANWDAIKLARIDSMLVDSNTSLVSVSFTVNGNPEELAIDVRGNVWVNFNCDYFDTPSEFPDELKNLIKTNRNWMLSDDDSVYVSENNWIELFYTVDGEWSLDTQVIEGEELGETEKELTDFILATIDSIYIN